MKRTDSLERHALPFSCEPLRRPQVNSSSLGRRSARRLKAPVCIALVVALVLACVDDDPSLNAGAASDQNEGWVEDQLSGWRRSGSAPWHLRPMLAVLDSEDCTAQTATGGVLAWRIVSDDRPLLIFAAIMIARCDRPSSERSETWFLANVYRHPDHENIWRPSLVSHVDWEPVRVFESRPSVSEVYAFIDETRWLRTDTPSGYELVFQAADGWVVHDAAINTEAWRTLVGTAPGDSQDAH